MRMVQKPSRIIVKKLVKIVAKIERSIKGAFCRSLDNLVDFFYKE